MVYRVDPDQLRAPRDGEQAGRGHEYFDQLRRRLRWRLLVTYMTPLILLSLYFHFHYHATLRERIHNHLRSVAESQRSTVDLFLFERVANLNSSFRAEALARSGSEAEMPRLLAELRAKSPTFVDVGLFSPEGILVDYAGPFASLRGKDYSGEAWWRRLLAQQREYLISDVYLGFRGQPHFIIALRRLLDGRPWVLRASVDPQEFAEFVSRPHLGEETETFIVNGSGQRQTLSGAKASAGEEPFVPARSPETLVSEVLARGRPYLCAHAWLVENDWALVVRLPRAVAFRPARQARFILSGFLLLTLALIVFLVRRNTDRLVGQLESADSAKEQLRLQLFHAAKLASIGEMAAGVAHEINNPLAIVYEEAGMIQDLLDPQFGQRPEPEELRERIAAIMTAALRGRSITSKLLAFSRQHEPVAEPTDVNRLLERILEVKELEFRVSNIEVRKELAAGLPEVLVHRNQMDQVLLNLLNNARDAISGGGRITARTGRQGPWVSLAIADTGCGMTAEQMERIFFPFFTTKGVGKGTGLGLSISYGIVKSLGGRIEVASEPGTGTTFTILLPTGGQPPAEAAESRGARGAHA